MVFEKTKLLSPKMKPKDLALLLDGFSKQRVRSGQNFHRNTMSLLRVLRAPRINYAKASKFVRVLIVKMI